jgi:subtilisin family serine protease
LPDEDRDKLEHAEKDIPHLYEHLMNIYFHLHPRRGRESAPGFRRVSVEMAEDFLQSIPRESPKPGWSPLKVLLTSTGYFAKDYFPSFRKFVRPVSRKLKGQDLLEEMGVRQAHHIATGDGIQVAIIDTGIDASLRELRARVKKTKNFLDHSKPEGEKGRFPFDWEGHGTSVASVVHQVAPKADLMIVKVYERESMGAVPPTRWTGYLLAAGMRWAVAHGADVVNLSVALRADLPAVRKAAQYCWENNVVLVTPMGNARVKEDRTVVYFPAYYPWTIAVGGTERVGETLKLWNRTTFGDYLDLVAPADDLWVEVPSYRGALRQAKPADGNSLASSFVAGTSALILSAMNDTARARFKNRPGELCREVRKVLRQTASNDALGFDTPNPYSGHGMVGVLEAVREAGISREN